jgi:hypothetical protein
MLTFLANWIVNIVQPLSVIVFLIAGIAALLVHKTHLGLIDLCIAITNFVIFYGGKFLK